MLEVPINPGGTRRRLGCGVLKVLWSRSVVWVQETAVRNGRTRDAGSSAKLFGFGVDRDWPSLRIVPGGNLAATTLCGFFWSQEPLVLAGGPAPAGGFRFGHFSAGTTIKLLYFQPDYTVQFCYLHRALHVLLLRVRWLHHVAKDGVRCGRP